MADLELIAPVEMPQYDEKGNMTVPWRHYYARVDAIRQDHEDTLTDHETRITALEP